MKTSPLRGVNVLDMTRVLAGPLCSMTLGDLGANVIKVERAGHGDETRSWGPPFDHDGQSAYYLSVNRNKLSVAVDLDRSDDLAFLAALIKDADVVLDNFLPGVLARRGVNKQQLLEQHPRLIWCTISGFGPQSMRPGYDFVVQAESGWMAITGPVDGAPHKVGVALVDVIAGKDAATAVLAALTARAMGVESERALEVTLAGSAAAALVNVAQNTLVTGKEAGRFGNAHPNLAPYQLFDARDRPLVIAVGSDGQWRALVRALSLGAPGESAELATNASRLANRERVTQLIGDRIATDDAATWIPRLERAGVPCGVVRSVTEALRDIEASPTVGVTPAAGGTIRLAPPRLNEHENLIRCHHWSAFDHVPILVRRGA